jgi:hypothetical protein
MTRSKFSAYEDTTLKLNVTATKNSSEPAGYNTIEGERLVAVKMAVC